MTREEAYAKLTGVFRDLFDDEAITLSDATTAADIDGWDSLKHILLIDAVEDAFSMRFDMKDVVGMKNVGEMVDAILKQ